MLGIELELEVVGDLRSVEKEDLSAEGEVTARRVAILIVFLSLLFAVW